MTIRKIGMAARMATILAAVFMATSYTNTALSNESLYPGEERLLIGDRVDVVAHNFDWLMACRYNYDYRDFLNMLKDQSKTDWRYFKVNGARSFDQSEGCTHNAMRDTVKWLDRYLAEVKEVAQICAGMTDCKQAGKWFSPAASPSYRRITDRSR